jgi:hypothetical protein
MKHAVACFMNGHVKQIVVQNSYDTYQNVSTLNTINKGSFEFASVTDF